MAYQKLNLGDYDVNGDGVLDPREQINLEEDLDTKLKEARKWKAYGATALISAFTVLSVASSMWVYRQGWLHLGEKIATAIGIASVALVEGTFIWLVKNLMVSFTTRKERYAAFSGVGFLVATMIFNIVTHFMAGKGVGVNNYQQGWLDYGSLVVFGVIVPLILFIIFSDPDNAMFRSELIVRGKETEVVLDARSRAIKSGEVSKAATERAASEALDAAERIKNGGRSNYIPSYAAAKPSPNLDPLIAYREPPEDLDDLTPEELLMIIRARKTQTRGGSPKNARGVTRNQ
jgi:hypothetical protein